MVYSKFKLVFLTAFLFLFLFSCSGSSDKEITQNSAWSNKQPNSIDKQKFAKSVKIKSGSSEVFNVDNQLNNITKLEYAKLSHCEEYEVGIVYHMQRTALDNNKVADKKFALCRFVPGVIYHDNFPHKALEKFASPENNDQTFVQMCTNTKGISSKDLYSFTDYTISVLYSKLYKNNFDSTVNCEELRDKLANLTEITIDDISVKQYFNLAVLAEFSGLEKIVISYLVAFNLDKISHLTGLKVIKLRSMTLETLALLKPFSNLQRLEIDSPFLVNVSDLLLLNNLKSARIASNSILNPDFLNILPKLKLDYFSSMSGVLSIRNLNYIEFNDKSGRNKLREDLEEFNNVENAITVLTGMSN